MKIYSIPLLLSLLSLIPKSSAQSLPKETILKIDSLFSTWNNKNSPGCAIGIIRNDSLIYSKGYGMANLESEIPITPSTIFYMCSVSKQFTGYSTLWYNPPLYLYFMTAYLSVSISQRKLVDQAIHTITETLDGFKISSFVFVDHYSFDKQEEKQMMKQAMTDIDQCDFLIAETSDKGIGIGVEVGYAKAKGKPVIYLRQKDAEHSTTVSGISDFSVIYSDENDLKNQLTDIINNLTNVLNKIEINQA